VLFTSLAQARQALRAWKEDYNTVRPHSALGNIPPAIYAAISAPEKQRAGTLALVEGSAPHPVAPRPRLGSNDERIFLSNG
jgi:putative transposase